MARSRGRVSKLSSIAWPSSATRRPSASVRAAEAARGVLSEVVADRPTNAIRLARHIYEYELQIDYVLDLPRVRRSQLRADDARNRLLMVELVPELRLTKKMKRRLTEIVEKSESEAASRDWTKKRGKPEDGPTLPKFERMAQLLAARWTDRDQHYNLVYRGASAISHPGLLAADTYVELAGGKFRIRDSTADPVREVLALVTATAAFINIMDTTNWILGARHGAESRALSERLVAI